MEVYKKGIIRVDLELHIVANTQKGSMHLAGCGLMPGILTISTIDLNSKQFSIEGHWFDMSDFAFEKPVVLGLEQKKG